MAGGERGSAVSVCDLLGRVHLARGRLDAALGTYQLALEIATEPGQPALPVAGIAYAGMAEALTLASPEGYVRVFADEGPPMRALLARVVAARRAGAGPGPGHPVQAPGPGYGGVRGQAWRAGLGAGCRDRGAWPGGPADRP